MSTKSKNERQVLRIGIIQGGKIIEERTLKRRETVSVGQDPKNSFSVTSDKLPKSLQLFVLQGGEYYLAFDAATMGGVVQLSDGDVNDLKNLEGRPETTKDASGHKVQLNDSSRGKVKLGDITVLFQFRDPPEVAARAILPSEVKGSFISNIDVEFYSILVAVSVFLYSLAVYARSVPYIEPTTIEEVSERYQRLIMPDRDPAPLETEDEGEAEDEGKEKKKEKAKEKKPEKVAKKKPKKSDKPVDAEAAARAKKDAIKKEVAGKGLLGVIGTKGKGDGALADVFSDGAFGDGELGDAFSGIQGVDIASGSGQRGTRGGGSGEAASLGTLATEGGGSVNTGKKTESAVRGNVGAQAPSVEGDLSPDVIKREMRRRMRAIKDCYERQLKRFPDLSGKLVISFEILETGRVSELAVEEDSLGNSAVKSCILGRAKRWRFPRPSGGAVFVSFPLVFTPAS